MTEQQVYEVLEELSRLRAASLSRPPRRRDRGRRRLRAGGKRGVPPTRPLHRRSQPVLAQDGHDRTGRTGAGSPQPSLRRGFRDARRRQRRGPPGPGGLQRCAPAGCRPRQPPRCGSPGAGRAAPTRSGPSSCSPPWTRPAWRWSAPLGMRVSTRPGRRGSCEGMKSSSRWQPDLVRVRGRVEPDRRQPRCSRSPHSFEGGRDGAGDPGTSRSRNSPRVTRATCWCRRWAPRTTV